MDSLVNGEIVNIVIVSGTNTNCENGSSDPACTDDWPEPIDVPEPTDDFELPFTGSATLGLLFFGLGAVALGLGLRGPRRSGAGRAHR